MSGKVYLVGSGPGDPGLLTIKGMECIRRADVIVYDRLVHPSLLSYASPDAELIYAGKTPGEHTLKQEVINHLLISKAKEGKTVCRLKGGDPFVFGRGGEEAEALASEGIEFEIVPGVTSAIAVPAYAGIPVTHRDYCSALGIITGHEKAEEKPLTVENKFECEVSKGFSSSSTTANKGSKLRWDKIATGLDTLVFLMGIENLPLIVSELIKNGRNPDTPTAIIRWGTRAEQETIVGTLGDIVDKVNKLGFKSPAVTIVGDVVRLREKLRWFDNRPLFGKKVLVTRSRSQASTLSQLLREHGAETIEFPVIKILPPESFSDLDSALKRIDTYDWLLFTSANGFYAIVNRLHDLGLDIRWLKGPKIGAIGPATANCIQQIGIRVDFIPSKFISEAIVEEFPENPSGKRILIPRAKETRDILPQKLREQGAEVDVVTSYIVGLEETGVSQIKEKLESGEIDIVTFTSSSTVKNFVKLLGINLLKGITIACIGPITAQTAVEAGLKPDIVAEEHTIKGLVSALVAKLKQDNKD
jgi:uroporphyrinogen III methyltransferase/synthase